MKEKYDETIVQALVLSSLGKCPDLGTGELRARVTWCALSDCPERREAKQRIKDIEVKLTNYGGCPVDTGVNRDRKTTVNSPPLF